MACFDEHLELPEQRDAPVPRGWSMKLGHRKRHSARATVSEVVLCGRSTVKRSVNSGRRWENPGFWEKKKLPLALCGCFRYRDGPAETATSRKSENEKMKDPEVQRVAQTLQAQRVKLCCPELQHRLHDTFDAALTRLKPTQGLKSRVQEAVDYLQRRGARKRRP
eukprot:g30602.t1